MTCQNRTQNEQKGIYIFVNSTRGGSSTISLPLLRCAKAVMESLKK